MICRVCDSPELSFVRCVEETPDRYWLECHGCGSLNSTWTWEEVRHLYDYDYVTINTNDEGRAAHCEIFSYNRNTFNELAGSLSKTFLDVGCLEGCAIEVMRAAGWDVWGFDVNPHVPAFVSERVGISAERVIVAESLRAALLPQWFTAILCSEVIEHDHDPRRLLREIWQALTPGGTLMLQTPRPSPIRKLEWDQRAHLTIISERALRRIVHEAGFQIDEFRSRIWPTEFDQRDLYGQLYVCRKPE